MKGKEQINLKEKLETKNQVQSNLTKKARNDRGITLIALVVTIIVLLILAGVTITAVLGEGGIIERAQEAADKTKNAVDATEKDLAGLSNLIEGILGGGGNPNDPDDTPKTDITEPENKYPEETVEDESEKSVVETVVVPTKENNKLMVYTVSWISKTSVEKGIEGTTYTINLSNLGIDFTKYSLKVENEAVMTTLEDFQNYLELKNKGNMGLEGDTTGRRAQATAEQLHDHSLDGEHLTIKSINVSCEGNTCKITIEESFENLYGLSESSYHTTQTTAGEAITVVYPGIKFELVPTEKTVVADGSFDGQVNAPKLGAGMTPIKWDDTGKTIVETTNSDEDWYNYSSQGKDTNHWANAVLKDTDGKIESYWVWIPRFAYKITKGYHTGGLDATGEIDVKFLHGTGNNYTTSGTQTAEAETSVTVDAKTSTVVTDYVVHPAFEWNGEQISGIWVAKFEASRTGASPTDDGTGEPLKVVPGVRSWTNIKISEIYDKCENYNKDLQSHLMKNREWGAVAYLAQSQYGLNSGNTTGVYKEIGVNECSDKITGAGPGGSADVHDGSKGWYSYDVKSSEFESTYGYTGTQGVKASTTGNVYGVYDMSGGSWEYVAAYVDNGHNNIGTNGGNLETASKSSTVDVYESITKTGSGALVDKDYEKSQKKYGDAVWETSYGYNSNWGSWFYDTAHFPQAQGPFFERGGYWDEGSRAGLFATSGGSRRGI